MRRLARAVGVRVSGLLGPVATVFSLPWRLVPLRPDRVAFISFGGGGRHEFSCNPKYVLLALQRATDRLDLTWVVTDPDQYPELARRGVRLVRHGTPAAVHHLLTASVVVSNGAYLMWFPFRRSQFVVNTWHAGGAYKRIPGDHSGADPVLRRKLAHSARVTDLVLSSCRLFTTEEVRGAFGYEGEVAEVGLPRNDLLVTGDHEELDARTRTALGLPAGARTVLVAPTLREDASAVEPLDQAGLVEALGRRFGGDWWVLYRAHKLSSPAGGPPAGTRWLDVGDYPDIQELLGFADVLVTDYSSTVWDFSLTGKPCFLYLPDLAALRRNPGFYVDPAEWGFPLAATNAALRGAIGEWDPERHRAGVEHHHRLLGSVETGHAATDVAALILDRLAGGARPVHDGTAPAAGS